jgi:hypothetical protein
MSNSRKHLYLALAFVLLALSACRFGLPGGPDRATRTAQAAGREETRTATRVVSTVPPLITPTPGAETATPQATITPRPGSESSTPTWTPTPAWTPTPTPAAQLVLSTPTPTSTPTPVSMPAPRLVLVTPTPTPTSAAGLVVTTPTPTSPAKLVVTTPTPLAAVGGLPELPDDGPLPALWIEIEFGGMDEGYSARGQSDIAQTSGGVYHVQTLALDAEDEIVYALGSCDADVYASEDRPRQCLLTFDLVEDRVQPPGAVELPAEIQGESRLYAAGDTLYLHRRWAGALYVLDSGTLSVREVISDVYGVALDGGAPEASAPYVVTAEGLSRLGSDLRASRVPREYDTMPVDMAAWDDRVYLLVDGALHVFDARLAPVATFQEEGVHLYNLALDGANRRLYVGSYDGLYALDLETGRFGRTSADVGQVWALAVDGTGQRLFALSARMSDWFGATDVVAMDTANWRTRALFSVRSGQLSDLTYDTNRDRVLVASADDHALIPIDASARAAVPTGADHVGQRLPLGIEIVEVVVGDSLYASDSSGWVQVLDRHTYAEIGRVYGGRSISLDPVHGRLYAGDERVPVVSVYNARTLELERVLPQAGKPRAHPATGEVVIVNRKYHVYDGASGQAAGELLAGIGEPPAECLGCYYTIAREVTIDARRGLTATTTYTPWPGKPGPEESIDYDPASGRAYYGLLTGGYVRLSSTAIYSDLGSLQAREKPLLSLEGLSGQIKLDPAARRLYVARGNVLFILDSETLNRVGRLYADGWTPAIAAVDDELGRLYSTRGGRLLVWTRTGGARPPVLSAVPAAVTNTVASILPSPNYALDGTLLATIDGRLVRSTDRGRTWQRLQGGLPRFDDYTYSVHTAFSPAYATDRRMFVGIHLGDTHGEGVYCSEDGGDTWALCSDGLYDLRVTRIVPSPDFGRDRTLVAYARTQTGDAVYRSGDAGGHWQLVLRQTDYGTPPLPRVEDLWSQREYLARFRCDYVGACERSDDGGGTWAPFDTGGVRLERYVGYALSPQYARDGTVYFLTDSDLYRYQSANRAWSIGVLPAAAGRQRGLGEGWTSLAAAAAGAETHDLFLGSAAGEFYRFAASELAWAAVTPVRAPPAATPSPTPCALAVDPRLRLAKEADISDLGCAAAPAQEIGAAFQSFERGQMFWRGDLQLIYVLQEGGTWDGYEDKWMPDQGDPDLSPPQGLYRPVRGFGRVWSLDLGGPPSPIGWGTAPERGYAMVVQPFARGLLLSGPNDDVYALHDDGTWRSP